MQTVWTQFIIGSKMFDTTCMMTFMKIFFLKKLILKEISRRQKTFVNSLDPDQVRQNVGPDLDPNCLTLWWQWWKNFLKKLILKIASRRQKTFANSLDPDQAQQYFRLDLDPNCLTLMTFMKEFFKKKQVDDKKLLQTFWTQIRSDKMSDLIWIQTVWHSDDIHERIFRKS